MVTLLLVIHTPSHQSLDKKNPWSYNHDYKSIELDNEYLTPGWVGRVNRVCFDEAGERPALSRNCNLHKDVGSQDAHSKLVPIFFERKESEHEAYTLVVPCY
jgi:hypothetical protein